MVLTQCKALLLALFLVGCSGLPRPEPRATIRLKNQGHVTARTFYRGTLYSAGPFQETCIRVDFPETNTILLVERGFESAYYTVDTRAYPGWYIVLPPQLRTSEFGKQVSKGCR